MGDVVITLLLDETGNLPAALDISPAPLLVTVFDEDLLLAAYKLAGDLRTAGLNVACYPVPAKLGKQFKYADRIGAHVALVLGPDEVANDQVAVKNLVDRGQTVVSQSEAPQLIGKILAGQKPS